MLQNVKIIAINADANKYHADKNSVPRGDKAFRMSPSAIKEFMVCPSRWVRGYESPDSKAKDFGNGVDALVLTPDSFDKRYAVRPETFKEKGMECPECNTITDSKSCRACGLQRIEVEVEKKWNAGSQSCRDWLKKIAAGVEVISPDDFSAFQAAAKRMRDDSIISTLIDGSDKQVLIRGEWLDKAAGVVIPVECLIDVFPRDDSEFFKSLGDVKCVSSAGLQPFTRKIHQFGWHIQAGFDMDMAIAATGRDFCNWVFVGVENYAPFEPFRRILDAEFLDIGRRTYKHALGLYAKCLKTGKFNSYDDLPASHPLAMDGFTLCAAEPWMSFEALEDSLEASHAAREESEAGGDEVPP